MKFSTFIAAVSLTLTCTLATALVGVEVTTTPYRFTSGNSTDMGLQTNSSAIGYASGVGFYTASTNPRGFVGWRGDQCAQPNAWGMYLWNIDNSPLYLGTSNAIRAMIDEQGRMGIGTVTPLERLCIGSGSGVAMKIDNLDDQSRGFRIAVNGASGSGTASVHTTSSGYSLTFGIDSIEKMRILATNGYVGIGTTNPTNMLTVAGTISAKEVKVTATGADYVFEEGYKLRPLSEVETFIKANRHLPEIASASEMQKNGVELADLVTKQLSKIEELTLYAIEADERTNALSKENARLNARLEAIERKLGIEAGK